MFSSHHPAKSDENLSLSTLGSRADHTLHSNRIALSRRPASRRGSTDTTSSIHSVGGTLSSSFTGGGTDVIYESGQNAISTLLQPPIVRTGFQPHTVAPASSTHKAPTARDIPLVTLTNIPQVDPEEFAPYLSQISALYEQLRRVKESDEEESSANRRGVKQDDPSDHAGDGYLRPGGRPRIARKDSIASLSSLSSLDGVNSAPRGSTAASRKNAQGPPPLSAIPTVYFEEDFHLENPRTFDVVSERSEVIRPTDAKRKEEGSEAMPAPRKTLATNAILQEKLSWYMDIIEIHLINSISTASTTFFTALGSLKELHSEAAESVQKIKTLRKELEALDEEIAANGLKIVEKRRRQENLRQLGDAVQQLKIIADNLAKCESLADAGEVDQALTNIDGLEKLISGERDESLVIEPNLRLRDLRSASALQEVNSDLTILRSRIGKAYEYQFSSILLSDLRRHVDSVSTADVLSRWNNAASRARGNGKASSGLPTYLTDTEALKAQLLPNMMGLHRAKHIATAAVAFREEVFREMRNMVRRPLPSATDDDNESMISVSTASGSRHLSSQEKSANLARNLRALDAEDAEKLLVKVYVGITESLRRLSTQVKVLMEIASSVSDFPSKNDGVRSPLARSPSTGPRPDRQAGLQTPSAFALQEELHKALDVGNLMAQAVDVAIDRVVKVLKVRSEQATHLPLEFFLRYFTLNLYFTYECEAISGRSGSPLKTVVNGHIKEFIQWHRDSEMQKLAQGMESDQWNAKDFSEKNTELLDQMLGCSTGDTEAWTENTRIWIPYQHCPQELSQDVISTETNGASKEKTRPAVIEMEKFVLPNSAILCLRGIGTFLQLIAGMPSMTADIATSLVTYLQLFNSRCTQLILGAGATRSAGLKNITTKHLALASQALSFIASLVPHMREFVRRHTGGSPGAGGANLMGEFDKIRRLLQEHQDSIHQKLVDIMSGRAAIHAKSVMGIDWDSSSTADAPRTYMGVLVKETTTLHRVLTKHLPEAHIQMIMLPVFAGYKDQLGNAFRQVDVQTELGRKRMLADVEYLAEKLSKIEGFGDTSQVLANIIQSKPVTATERTSGDRSSSSSSETKTRTADGSDRAASSERSSREEQS